jgi:hypothetical protein
MIGMSARAPIGLSGVAWSLFGIAVALFAAFAVLSAAGFAARGPRPVLSMLWCSSCSWPMPRSALWWRPGGRRTRSDGIRARRMPAATGMNATGTTQKMLVTEPGNTSTSSTVTLSCSPRPSSQRSGKIDNTPSGFLNGCSRSDPGLRAVMKSEQ